MYIFVIGVLVFSVVKNLRQTRLAKQRIQNTQEILADLEITNRELEDSLVKVETEEYSQEQVRNKLGLVKPGERVMVMPESEVVKSLSFRKKGVQIEELIEPNWKKWLRLFI